MKVVAAGTKMIPRLRDFVPAMLGYALNGNADKALEVYAQLVKLNLDMSGGNQALAVDVMSVQVCHCACMLACSVPPFSLEAWLSG